ncbi:hypothetical protein ACSLVK_14110 [Photorhabdus tasmaniensis]|uniref:hypothetical protein n=1 Tax=Photorhabdus tasmaniensis TaxID=1004159 RepID=UPI004041DD12
MSFPRLERKGLLVSSGEKRNKSYTLPGMSLPNPEEIFSSETINSVNNGLDLSQKEPSLPHKESSLPHKAPNLPHAASSLQITRDELGHLINPCCVRRWQGVSLF